MADEVKYVVYIKGLVGGSKEDEDEPKSSLTTGLGKIQKMMHPVQNLLKHHKEESSKGYFIREVAKNAISTLEVSTSISINRYFQMSENYKGQSYLNNVMSNINRTKNFGGGILTGAIGGSKFGPIGAIMGSTISAVSTIVQQNAQWQNVKANFNQSMNATRIETAFRAERAGLYDGGKGTEN